MLISNISFHRGPKIVTDGLVLYLDAANPKSYTGTGTVWKDLSGNSNDATLINGPTFDSDNAGSIVFDGVNDYVQVSPITTISPTGTISLWFKSSISWDGVATNIRLSGINPTWEFGRTGHNNSTDNGFIAYDLGGSDNLSTVTNSFSNQRWYCITVIWDVSTLVSSVYINGELDNTGNCFDSSRNGILQIGRSPGNTGQLYSGRMSNYKYYDRALTIEEIQQNYNATKSRFEL
jgi:hypothetical protein